MEMLQEIYTGTLDYKGIEFNFIFSGNELRPVPPKDKIQDVYRDFLTRPLGNGAYTMNIPVMEESHLLGKCNESARPCLKNQGKMKLCKPRKKSFSGKRATIVP